MNARAAKMIEEGMKDQALDVRIAAVLAAGQTKNRALLPALRECLKDPEPQVVFTAAVTLWKLKDHSGEDELKAVIVGDRKATPTLMHGAKNDVNHELHDPGALAGLGATEGAALLLGPFGFGVTAFEYIKKSGGNPARAEAINLLTESRTPGLREELITALYDKDATVRAAAARALGQLRDPSAVKPLGELFNDNRLPVRLTAAAAYINCSRPGTPRA
jgi:HEAT repeat protein